MCHHRTSCRRTQGPGEVQDGKTCLIYKKGERIGAEVECKAVRGSTGGDPDECSCPSRTLLAAGNEDGGMADGVAIGSKQDGTG